MSSTNRANAAKRNVADYYVTPIDKIKEFLDGFRADFNEKSLGVNPYGASPISILDPCAGGDAENPMSYPEAIRLHSGWNVGDFETIDVRPDSRAAFIQDYLFTNLNGERPYDIAITNPPFCIAIDIIQKCLREVRGGGLVIMLLRLNFFGSQERSEWFKQNMPALCYVHSQRINFTTELQRQRIIAAAKQKNEKPKGIGTDSVEYMHAVWIVGHKPRFAQLRIL